jgi:Protein of unknown function (DUF3237)
MTADTRVKALGDIRTEHLFDMVVDLDPRLNLGQRVLFGAAGGSFDGPDLRGEVLAGGGDWAVFRPGGTMTLDVRLTLRTHDDALVFMTYGGRWAVPPELRADLADPVKRYEIDPARYYFRTTPLFETGADRYSWLNDIVCVAAGYLVDGGIAYQVARVM